VSLFPTKTALAVASFTALIALPNYVPALRGLITATPAEIPEVWDMPVPEPPELKTRLISLQELRRARDQATAPEHLEASRQLDHFYEALRKGGTVRVMHFGDSPTTADLITADVRALLQKQFGDAGHGFVLIARPWAWYNHRGVEMESWNWNIDIGGVAEQKDGLYGPGAVRFRGSAGAAASWTFPGSHHTSVEIAYLTDPAGGTFEFEANGDVIGAGSTKADHVYPAYVTFPLPPGATSFSLRVTSGTVQLYGAEFRKDRPGVLYSSLGVNGAGVTLISKVLDGAHLATQLRHYKPDLVVLAYGTNESGYPDYVESSWGSELRAAVRRVRAALPQTSILLMSPMDRGEMGQDGAIHTVPALPRLVEIEARIAEEEGVAFFNSFEAMGGRDTMARWYAAEPRLVGSDFIHPMPAGAKIVGELLYSALRDGYNEYKLRKSAAAESRPVSGRP
jgi:lysophospholipase L1-like esterase